MHGMKPHVIESRQRLEIHFKIAERHRSTPGTPGILGV
jgi:hypothetical protein